MHKNNCFSNFNPCTGCGACYAVCPVSAIFYRLNQKGFYEAFVDEEKCVSCGKCVKACPKYIQNENQLDKNTFRAYSFVHQNPSFLAESASGAAAWALTEMAISKGYQVVGVEYNHNSNTARTVCAHTLKEAEKFKGSKYIQADTRIYKELLKKSGKFMVFGTPCQLAGLSQAAILQNRREDFLLVDCLCHGVPSYNVWQKFLEHIKIKNPISVSFRSKKGGWHNFFMEIKSADRTYYTDARKNPFYKLFFSGLLLNDSCYVCRVKSATYCDIRLGDLWGSKYDLNDRGVSVVLPISERGQSWIEKLSNAGCLQDSSCLRSKIVKSQSSFSNKQIKEKQREKLLTCFTNQPFEIAFSCYQAGLSKRRYFVNFIKSLCPLFIIKYIRFFVHKIKGY